MSTHNICFRREIKKILCGYPHLSVAMPMYGIHQITYSNHTMHCIALNKVQFFSQKVSIFFLFLDENLHFSFHLI